MSILKDRQLNHLYLIIADAAEEQMFRMTHKGWERSHSLQSLKS